MKRSVKVFITIAIVFVCIISISKITKHYSLQNKGSDNTTAKTDAIMQQLVAKDKECTDQLYDRLINMRHSDPETYDVVTEIARVKNFDNCDYVEFLKNRIGGQKQK